MRNLRTCAALAAFGIGLAALPAAGADAACTACITSCGQGGVAVTLSNGTINGNLVVPGDATCILRNEKVTGNVTVAGVLIVQAATIDGNISANHCGIMQLSGDSGPISVRGNVEIESCGGARIGGNGYGFGRNSITIGGNFTCSNNRTPFQSPACSAAGGSVGGNLRVNNNFGLGGAQVRANTVMGNVQVNNNTGGVVDEVTGNTVMGNMQVNNNTASQVGGNKIGGNLTCQGNVSVTNGGVPNTVAGNERGQCAGL